MLVTVADAVVPLARDIEDDGVHDAEAVTAELTDAVMDGDADVMDSVGDGVAVLVLAPESTTHTPGSVVDALDPLAHGVAISYRVNIATFPRTMRYAGPVGDSAGPNVTVVTFLKRLASIRVVKVGSAVYGAATRTATT